MSRCPQLRARRAPHRLHTVGPERHGRARHDRARRGAPARRRSRHGVRRARHLRPLPGRARRGHVRQVGDHRRAGRARAAGIDRDRLPRQPPARRRHRARLRGAHRRRRRGRRAADQPGPPPGRPQGPRPAADHGRPAFTLLVRRGAEARARIGRATTSRPAGDRRRALRRAARPCRADGRVRRAGVVARRRSTRRRGDHGRRRRGRPCRGDLAGLRRRRLRRRRRHRVDHDRRPPLRPHVGRGARQRRTDEPADPLRRGPDEPGLVRDDEPGRRPPADRGGARARSTSWSASCSRRAGHRARPRARGRAGRQPDHAPHRARHRPDPVGPGAVHARHQPRRRHAGRSISTWTLPNARVYVGPCIAGHVGADTAGAILAEGPHRSEHMQLLVDVGTNAEIVLGDRQPPVRGVEPDRAGVRGRADQLAVSAPPRARSRACASIRSRSSRGSR